jgi:leucyl aminopeptidase
MAEGLRFEVSAATAEGAKTDLLVLPMFEGPTLGPGGREIGVALGVDLVDTLRHNDIRGKPGDTFSLETLGNAASRSVLLVGVERGAGDGALGLREAAMRAGSAARPHARVATTLAQLGTDVERSASAIVEGFQLGAYRFDRHRTATAPARTKVVRVLVPTGSTTRARRGAVHGEIVGGATNWARDLTNAPAAESTPALLADEARSMAARLAMSCKVWTRGALERGGFGGILGVGAGSVNEPRLVELSYRGGGRSRPIAITGKGVTFDSGGLNVKRPSEMSWMRSDMAGAAAALATMRAVAELGLRVDVIAAIPLAENMSGSAAMRPGDVLRHRGGRTSEVVDTDSEGRLLLADALAYLSEKDPALILDSATLTDASGLGPDLWAVMGTDAELVREMLDAGAHAGEPGWEIPLWSRYRAALDSTVADVKNLGDHEFDSAMMAGLFLRDSVPDGIPWAHLDTGSSAWAEHPNGPWHEGATGAPTRAFIRFIEQRASRTGA